MRVVSLMPAATEIMCALGAERELVAVTHDCDFPASVGALPRITSSTIPPGSGSRAIDDAVREAAARGESTFHLDTDALRDAKPDVLLGQTLCRVCALTLDQLPASLAREPRTVPLDGGSLEGVFADIVRVALALDRSREARLLVARLRERLAAVAERVRGARYPRVVCLEWLDPLFNGGHWVPEQVAIAGGQDMLGVAGERSRVIEWDEVVAAEPDVVVLMPCGFNGERALAEAGALLARREWADLPAVRAGRAFAVDGNAYFSRPGPRLVDGVELLASLLHPARVQTAIRAFAVPTPVL